MAVHVTQWRPDTCGCVLEYEWDDEVEPDERLHTVRTHDDSACPRHKTLKMKKSAAFDHVLEENQRKNRVHAELVEHAAEHQPELVRLDADNTPSDLRPDAFKFSYDDDGVLHVELNDHSSTAKASARKVLKQKFGDAKVRVV